ncbi:MAG: hypothetical protein JW726_07685 [Anaerolineales bacterium]|nr:hypothetical protein [Anaerolineales bacterium]
MENRTTFIKVFTWLVALVVQYILTQAVTFILSVLFPNVGDFQYSEPLVFVLFLGLCFSTGTFAGGWFALMRGWISIKEMFLARWIGAVIGAFLPLLLELLIEGALEAGSPFFLIAILCSILGFYVPGWIWGRNR